MFKSFQEYIDQNKKLVEKPKVAKVADFEGKAPAKPEKEVLKKTDCGCSSGGKGQVGEVSPYSNGENAKNPNKEDTTGLVYKGNKELVYEPKVDEKSKESKTWPKTGMAEWVKETKNLSLSEFARKLKQENGGCSEGVQEASKEIVEACKCSGKNLVTFVREAKRGKILEALMREMFNLPESYEILSKLIENKNYSNKFDKMFNEMVAEPVGVEDEEGHEGMEGDEEDHEDMEDMGDDEEDHEDMEDMGDDEEDHEGMESGIEGMSQNSNPFLPKEATWHFKGIHDAPESAKDRMLGMRDPGMSDEGPSDLMKAYSELEHQLKQAKRKVKDIESKLIRFVQLRGVPTK